MLVLIALYVSVIALLLGTIGVLGERICSGTALPRRGIWLAVLVASVLMPVALLARSETPAQHAPAGPSADGPATGVRGTSRQEAMQARWVRRADAYQTLFLTLWAVASAGLALAAWAHALRLRRVRRFGDMVLDGHAITLTDDVGPAAVGAWTPEIYLPRWVLGLSPDDQAFIVRHEAEHVRGRDPQLLVIAGALLCACPWNLPLWWIVRRLRVAIEADCDRRVVTALGRPRDYGELLIRIANAAPRRLAPRPAFIGAARVLERRLRLLAEPRVPRGVETTGTLALALVVIAVVLTVPRPALAAPVEGTPRGARARVAIEAERVRMRLFADERSALEVLVRRRIDRELGAARAEVVRARNQR